MRIRVRDRAALALAFSVPTALGAQAIGDPATGPLGPGLTGNTVFVAPAIGCRIGPIRAAMGLRLDWGQIDSRAGDGRIGLKLVPGLDLIGRIRLSTATARLEAYDDRAAALGLATRRWGVRAGYRAADAATGSFDTDVSSVDARMWVDLGVIIGMTARNSEVIDRASDVLERRYQVAGYDFISRQEIAYLRSSRYQDLELDVSGRLGAVWLTAVAGRGFSRDATPDRTWAYVRMAAPLLNRFRVLAEAGREPGLPAILRRPSAFARIGLQIDLSGAAGSAGRKDPPIPVAAHDDDVAALARIDSDSAGAPVLVVSAPDARTVEVRGDFTDWRTIPMRPVAPGEWAIPVRAGVLRFNVRLDGGDWIVPGGVAAVPDEFSGSPVAIVIVAED